MTDQIPLHRSTIRAAQGARGLRGLLGMAALSAAMTMLGGCYKHVTQAGFTSTEVRETHEPNVEEEGPSWINQFMWGDPPKGENAMAYYRRMNSLGLQK